MKNKVQLISYPDSLGGDIAALGKTLKNQLGDLQLGGVHILPPFPSTGDRGFAPTTYREIEQAFGSWEDVTQLTSHTDVMVDLMINHISRHSVYFQDFLKYGRESKYADMFITLDKVWPDGIPLEGDVNKIFLRKPEHPFLDVEIEETGKTERIWTSFSKRVDYAEQIDLDVHSPLTRQFFTDMFKFLGEQGIRLIRIDAIGYVIKKAGTTCFMVEPDVYEVIDWLIATASDYDIELLPEVHDHYLTQFKLASHGYWVYDFVLPALVLHTLVARDGAKLVEHLNRCPRKQVTTLDCHDGIPVQPDMDDVLSIEESKRIVAWCEERGANINKIISDSAKAHGFDAHQINITYYDAVDRNDDAYLAARAIQFFAPGVPQVYYVGLLAGENDYEGLKVVGDGRAINRRNYSDAEIDQELSKPVVQRLVDLIRFRNSHPAFDGTVTAKLIDEGHFTIRRENDDKFCELAVDLETYACVITYSEAGGIKHYTI